jgi:hypothetical protein
MAGGGDNHHKAAPCFRSLLRAAPGNTGSAQLPTKFQSGGFAWQLYLRNQDTSAKPAVTGSKFERRLTLPQKEGKAPILSLIKF